MQKSALRFFLAWSYGTVFAECLIYSSLCFVWEADNLDGSRFNHLAVRKSCFSCWLRLRRWISRWIFRHRIALRFCLG